MGKTIEILKQKLREVREQRDRIRQTRDTRYLTPLLAPGGMLKGCDIDDAAIQWNLQNLQKSGDFFTSADHPPLPVPTTEQFDQIVVISVFTHIPEDMQDRWLEELTARLKPGGIMVATFYGP